VHFRSMAVFLACAMAAGTSSICAQLNTTSPLHYIPLATPCRAVDTRLTGGPIAGGTTQNFSPSSGGCSIPLPNDGIIAYAMNVTVVPHEGLGYLTVWPSGEQQPMVSTLNSYDGRVKANAAIVSGGNGGEISVFASNTTDVVLDVSGYFTTADASYVYVPITPCRAVDTRINNGTPFGAPGISGGTQRSFSLANSACNIPSGALANGGALSLNVTAIPSAGGLNYLTVWGTSPNSPEPPITSTLNAPSNDPVANAAIVSMDASNTGSVSVFASNTTDLLIDITGYFTTTTIAPSGLSLYETAPCRVLDTRLTTGVFNGEITVPFTASGSCSVPASAKAYVTNATVVPPSGLGYLTLWPDGTAIPTVSTLNAYDGSVTSNMAIVTTTNGAIDAFAYNPTQLILDLSGYFALAPNANLPSVVFIGDDAISSFGTTAFAQNPNWINKGIDGQTSGQVLARFQSDVINLHPSIVNIVVGVTDVASPGYGLSPCGSGNNPATATCSNIGAMAQMAQAAGIKTIVGTIPIDAQGVGENFNYGLRQTATYPNGTGIGIGLFGTPNTIMVDYQEGGFTADLANTAITLLNGVTIQSGYLDNPGDVNTIAVGGTIPFTAYGIYSDGVTRPVSNYIYYEGPCSWASNNGSVMSIDSTLADPNLGVATARSAGQAWISANCGGVEFSPWIVTVQ
jgi:hypothetical protein